MRLLPAVARLVEPLVQPQVCWPHPADTQSLQQSPHCYTEQDQHLNRSITHHQTIKMICGVDGRRPTCNLGMGSLVTQSRFQTRLKKGRGRWEGATGGKGIN